jgi:predicted CoA-binding protein
MSISTREDIDDFLAQKRIAFVGVSRDPKDFSRGLFRDLQKRGYDVVPVNPNINEIDGARCFARLQEVTPPVEGALVMTAPETSEGIVQDCAAAGIERVWLHRGAGVGAVSDAAVRFCQEHQLTVVAGHCPYMFLPKTPWFHRAHGFFLRLRGQYPVCATR